MPPLPCTFHNSWLHPADIMSCTTMPGPQRGCRPLTFVLVPCRLSGQASRSCHSTCQRIDAGYRSSCSKPASAGRDVGPHGERSSAADRRHTCSRLYTPPCSAPAPWVAHSPLKAACVASYAVAAMACLPASLPAHSPPLGGRQLQPLGLQGLSPPASDQQAGRWGQSTTIV